MSKLSVTNRILLYLPFILFSLVATETFALTPDQVYDRVKDSIVVVKAYDERGSLKAFGSGVMLSSGKFVTNYHVIKKGKLYKVGQGKNFVSAVLEGKDPKKDICILSAVGISAKAATLGQAANLKVGERVYAIGAPQGLELSLSEGIVSQLRGGPPPLIQTTVPISPGSSGGGLFNAKGELVGITTFGVQDSQNLNFALPVEWIGKVTRCKTPEPGAVVDDKPTCITMPGARPKEYWAKQVLPLEKNRDWQGMLACSRRWTQAEPDNELAWHILGVAYSRLQRYSEAIEAFQKCLRLKPNDANALYDLGAAYGKLGRYHEAIEAFQKCLRLKPNEAEAMYNLGIAYALVGDRNAALEEVRGLRRYDPAKAEELLNFINKP